LIAFALVGVKVVRDSPIETEVSLSPFRLFFSLFLLLLAFSLLSFSPLLSHANPDKLVWSFSTLKEDVTLESHSPGRFSLSLSISI